MPMPGIRQPDIIFVEDELRLRKFSGDCTAALAWYQDEETLLMVDGKNCPYDMERLMNMYQYLQQQGEVYFIEVREDGIFRPIGDVSFWQEDMPIVIGEKPLRGRGIGRKVLSALVERARMLGFPKLKVREIYEENLISRRLFEGLGFQKAEDTPRGASYTLHLRHMEEKAIKVAPSILAADMLNMGRDVQRMIDAGADWLHVDIMDAHFVPNLSYGPALVAALHKAFPELPLDVHLMMDNPEKYLDIFMDAGAAVLTIHAEIPGNTADMLRQIRARGVLSGLSVKPGTPVETIRPLLQEADMLLVMTVEPGFGGQKFNADCVAKLDELRQMGYTGLIEADGGVSMKNIALLREHGLDVAVMGTAMLNSRDPKADMDVIHAL